MKEFIVSYSSPLVTREGVRGNVECGSRHPTLEDVWCERLAHEGNRHIGFFDDGHEWVSVMWTS